MFHLNDRTLERLINGTASGIEVDRIRRHVDECRACSRRLEEWRDNFGEVDRHFPQLATENSTTTTRTSGLLVVMPPSEERRAFSLSMVSILWGVAGVLAVVVVYGLARLETSSGEGGEFAFRNDSQATRLPPAPVPSGDSTTRDTLRDTATPEPPPRPVVREPADTSPPPLGVSRRFRSVQRVEAARRLGGAVRGVAGLVPDHYEIGPASAVPGAQRNIDVVRVVYRVGNGGRLTLDQQVIRADSSGFRPIDDSALESGETVFRTGTDGANSATWLDEAGYRISLSARVSQDSLRKLLPRVQ